MKLFVLRHGIAVNPGEAGLAKGAKDAERPLAGHGKKRLRRIAEAMRALDLKFDLILSSPLLRARQTAEIISETLVPQRHPILTDDLRPEGKPSLLLQEIQTLYSRRRQILIVGHEPYLSQLISQLISGQGQSQIEPEFRSGNSSQ
jgi:phosphohistidine phosphatase